MSNMNHCKFLMSYLKAWHLLLYKQYITNVTLPSKMNHIDTFHEILIFTDL